MKAHQTGAPGTQPEATFAVAKPRINASDPGEIFGRVVLREHFAAHTAYIVLAEEPEAAVLAFVK
jgi:hypothetical protein